MTTPPLRLCPALSSLIDDAMSQMQSELLSLSTSTQLVSNLFKRLLGRNPTLPFLLWRKTNGDIGRFVDAKFETEKYEVFEAGTEAVAACMLSEEEVDGVLTKCIFVMAQERGVPRTLFALQPADFETGRTIGKRRV